MLCFATAEKKWFSSTKRFNWTIDYLWYWRSILGNQITNSALVMGKMPKRILQAYAALKYFWPVSSHLASSTPNTFSNTVYIQIEIVYFLCHWLVITKWCCIYAVTPLVVKKLHKLQTSSLGASNCSSISSSSKELIDSPEPRGSDA